MAQPAALPAPYPIELPFDHSRACVRSMESDLQQMHILAKNLLFRAQELRDTAPDRLPKETEVILQSAKEVSSQVDVMLGALPGVKRRDMQHVIDISITGSKEFNEATRLKKEIQKALVDEIQGRDLLYFFEKKPIDESESAKILHQSKIDRLTLMFKSSRLIRLKKELELNQFYLSQKPTSDNLVEYLTDESKVLVQEIQKLDQDIRAIHLNLVNDKEKIKAAEDELKKKQKN